MMMMMMSRHDAVAAATVRGGALSPRSHNSSPLASVLLIVFLFTTSFSLLLPFQFARGLSASTISSRHTTSAVYCKNQQVFVLLANRRSSNSDDSDNNDDDVVVTLESLMENQRRQSLMEALIFNRKGGSSQEEENSRLVQVHLQGKASLATGGITGGSNNNKTISSWFGGPQEPEGDCLVLSTTPSPSSSSSRGSSSSSTTTPIPCLLVPLPNAFQLSLVEAAFIAQPISNTQLWRLNMLTVNRDGGLFDGIPWNAWTIDPLLRNRDAAGNAINAKFHLGKRDAYNVMMGKDWKGRSSLAMANLAQHLRQKLPLDLESSSSSSSDTTAKDEDDNEDASILARRLLELQIKELEMDIAECDYQLAILMNNNNNNNNMNDNNPENQDESSPKEELVVELESKKRQALVQDLQTLRERFQQVTTMSKQSSSSLMTQVLDRIQQDASNSQNRAPYRGAMGYDPYLDNDENKSNEPYSYTCPYDMICEILENQLEAQVIGAVLENTSWLSGTIALGGALVLRRKTALEKVSLAGQDVVISNEEQDHGNPGIRGGETFLVECDADEAISMSLACNIPLQVDSFILERSSVMAQPKQQQQQQQQQDDTDSIIDNAARSKSRRRRRQELPEWETVDPELSVLFEGQAGNMATTERVAPIRIPRTTMSLYDSLFEPTSQQQQQEMFPTDNPIQSLSAYDSMSNEEKAVTLMTMSNFPRDQRLPRPRAVRQSEQQQQQQQQGNNSGGRIPPKNALDELLLPLIDESVRREYRLRDAQRSGDQDLVEQLQRETSRRQVAKAKAAQARANADYEKNNGVADWWQSEADLYDSLKADVTQDDGSYSRFLDKDEDYERNRRRLAARVNKNKFGTLLDGMD